MSQELQDYIAQARKKGFSDAQIYDQLLEAGWNKKDVAEKLGLTIPTKLTHSKNMSKNILIPVAVRFIGIVLLFTVGGLSWLLYGVLGGQSKPPIINPQSVIFIFLPAGLLTLSIITLLIGKGSNPANLLPDSSIKDFSRKFIKVGNFFILLLVILGVISFVQLIRLFLLIN